MSSHSGTSGDQSDTSPLQLFNISGVSVPLTSQDCEAMLGIVEKHEDICFSLLEVVYVDEEEIRRINREYLNRSYITDIISFSYDNLQQNESPAQTNANREQESASFNTSHEGTLYCCTQRILEQADELNTDQKEEFSRVFIHGLLHLAGYDDQSPEDKKQMTALEDTYLSLYQTSGH